MRAASTAALAPVVAMACALALPQAAQGADYLRGSQIEQPVEAPPLFGGGRFDWSGFYFGGGAGISDTKFKPSKGVGDLVNYAYRNTAIGQQNNLSALVGNLTEKRDSGSTFFGIIGYNYLFDDVVIGFELDYTKSNYAYRLGDYISREYNRPGVPSDRQGISIASNQGATLNDYATARLRMGWAYGRLMPYATIGGAVGRFNTVSQITTDSQFRVNAGLPDESIQQVDGYPLTVGGRKKNTYTFGMTAGAGVDWALTDNLFLRAEYQFIRFAEIEGTTTTINTGRVAAALKF
jgi:opacity protein-like surface antigen